jgi:hypothetical protein
MQRIAALPKAYRRKPIAELPKKWEVESGKMRIIIKL